MRIVSLACVIWFFGAVAVAQDEPAPEENPASEEESAPPAAEESPEEEPPPEPEESPRLQLAPDLPAPTLEGAEPIGSAEPLPEMTSEPEQPTILEHIGTGDHPEWESDDDGELPHDISFETPGDPRSTVTTPTSSGPGAHGTQPEEEPPPYVLAAGAGFAQYLTVGGSLDFFRVEERFEATIPELSGIRLGLAASQMVSDQGFIVGGGARVGMGVILCDEGDLQCEGVIYVQPGFLAGLTGPRFDLNANLSLRLLLFHSVSVSADGGYSLLFDGFSLVHLTGSVGAMF